MTAVVVQPLTFPDVNARPEAVPLAVGRLAAIDIGSNSIHMIVVAPDAGGGYRVLGREREMVRLGKTAHGRGALSETARYRLLGLTALPTSGRESGTKPSRFGIFTAGSVRASRTSASPMIPFRYKR